MKITGARLVDVIGNDKIADVLNENEFGIKIRIELELLDKKDKELYENMARQLQEGRVGIRLSYKYTDDHNAVLDAMVIFKK